MDKTGNNRKILHWLVLLSINGLLIFLCAFAADILLAGKIGYGKNLRQHLLSIETNRSRTEDIINRANLIDQGYAPLIFPDLIKNETDVIEYVGPQNLLPLASLPNIKVYYCNEGYGTVSYTTDRFGFRNPDSAWDDFSGEDATLLIGDSFAQGACVNEEQHIVPRIRSLGLKAATLGVGSNSPIHYAATAKVFIQKTRPANVVMLFYPNDNDERTSEQVSQEDPWYRIYFLENRASDYFASSKLELSRNVLIAASKMQRVATSKIDFSVTPGHEEVIPKPEFNDYLNIIKIIESDNLLLLNLRRSILAIYTQLNAETSIPFTTKLAVDTMRDECRHVSCKPYVAFIPNSHYWGPDPRASRYKKALKDYASSNNMGFIDLTRTIDSSSLDDYAIKGPHLSPAAYSKVASLIATEIRN